MHTAADDIPVSVELDAGTIRLERWGGMYVGIERYDREFDMAPLLEGLPDDRCQCRHWGYVLDGSVDVDHGDREETLEAGDLYYLEPGHRAIAEAGVEYVSFSPVDEARETLDVIARNLARRE